MENKINPNTKPHPTTDMDVLAQAMEMVKTGKAGQLAAAIQAVQNQEKKNANTNAGSGAPRVPGGLVFEINEIIGHGPVPIGPNAFVPFLPTEVVARLMEDMMNRQAAKSMSASSNPCDFCENDECPRWNGGDEDPEDCDDDGVNVYDLLHAAGINHINDTMIAMPTAYGRLLMMHPSQPATEVVDYLCYGSDEDDVDHDKNPDIEDCISGSAWTICTVNIEGDKVVYDPAKDGDWIAFMVDPCGEFANNTTDRYVFPIMVDDIKNDHSLGGAPLGSPDDIMIVADSMFNAELVDFELPHLAYKITKPGMKCKSEQYAMETFITFDGEPILHKQGFHFADNKAALYGWYPTFSSENEVYRVQVSDIADIENGVGVAGSILFTEKVDWTDIR